jgi:predicted DNA-binding transcriptional regulator AlpA
MELLGVAEAAELLGWDRRKISTYISRGVFPDPVQIVKATPLWTRDQIESYKLKQKNPKK